MIRLACTADLHIGLPIARADVDRTIDAMASDIERRADAGQRFDAIAVCGDVSHATPRPIEVLTEVRLAQRFSAVSPVIFLRGNHDPRFSLDVLRHLETQHPIAVFDRPGVLHALPGVAIGVMPWLDHVGPAPGARMSSEQRASARQKAIEMVFDQLGGELAAHAGEKVFLGHLTVAGALPRGKRPPGQPEARGQEFEVSLADLGRVEASAYVLGHVHSAREWRIDNAPVLYVGSPDSHDFGDLAAKSYVILTIENGVATVERVPLAAVRRVVISNAWDREAGWSSALGETDIAGAVVRFSYDVAAHSAAQGRDAAEQMKASLIAAGATEVKIERRLVVDRRARVELGADHSVLDLFHAWAERQDVEPGLRAHAAELLVELEAQVGARRGAIPAGGMRLHRTRFRGIGPFTEEVELDLDAIPGEIVAICGENGEGKSLLCSLFPAALHRRSERGAIADEDLGSDAYLEATVSVDGEPWVLEHRPGDVKAWVKRPDGTAVDESGKVSAFDRWADEHLAPPPVMRSLVAEQGDEGIVWQRPPARRKTLLAALGGETLAQLAKAASERAKKPRAAANERARKVASVVERLALIPDGIEGTVAALKARLADVEQAIAGARADVETERAALDAGATRDRLTSALSRARSELADIEKKIADHAAILGRAATIRDAAERVEAARAELAKLGDETSRADRDLATSLSDARSARAQADGARARERQALLAFERADALLKEAPAIQDAVREVKRISDRIEADRQTIASLDARLAAIRTASQQAVTGRIDGLRKGHVDIIAEPGAAADIAQATLDADDIAAGDADPAVIGALERQLSAHRSALDALLGQAGDVSRKAARAELLSRAEEDRAAATIAAKSERGNAEGHDAMAVTAEGVATAARNARDHLRVKAADLGVEIERLRPLANQIEALRRAEGAADTLASHRAAAAERVSAALAELDALPPVQPRPVAPSASARLEGLIWEDRAIAGDLRLAEDRLSNHRKLTAELDALRGEKQDAQLAEAWELLAGALGPKAMQSLAIDLACPELTEAANDLIHTCLGPRWTMRFETSRPRDDGGEIDECLILVTDAETGIERDARKFSKGQRSVLGLAASLSLAALVCGRAGVEGPTIVIDEGADDVSVGNVEAYMAMLRRAARQIGASKVLLVTHREDIAGLADVTIEVEGGKVIVES